MRGSAFMLLLEQKTFFKNLSQEEVEKLTLEFGGVTQQKNDFFVFCETHENVTKEQIFDLFLNQDVNLKFYIPKHEKSRMVEYCLLHEYLVHKSHFAKGFCKMEDSSIAFDEIQMVEIKITLSNKNLENFLSIAHYQNDILKQENTAIEILTKEEEVYLLIV